MLLLTTNQWYSAIGHSSRSIHLEYNWPEIERMFPLRSKGQCAISSFFWSSVGVGIVHHCSPIPSAGMRLLLHKFLRWEKQFGQTHFVLGVTGWDSVIVEQNVYTLWHETRWTFSGEGSAISDVRGNYGLYGVGVKFWVHCYVLNSAVHDCRVTFVIPSQHVLHLGSESRRRLFVSCVFW